MKSNKRSMAAVILFSLILCVCLCGCGKINPVSPDDFRSAAEGLDYSVTDVTSSAPGSDVEQSYVAVSSDKKVRVVYLDMDSEDSCKAAYTNLATRLGEQMSVSSNKHSSVSTDQHAHEQYVTKSNYGYVARVEDTIVFILGYGSDSGDEAKKLLDEIGY